MKSQPIVAYLSLGSNQGDRMAYLSRSGSFINKKGIKVIQQSQVYETEPLYKEDGPDWFLNQVLAVETTLPPLDLLQALQTIEKKLGRKGGHGKGPRSIDIDILLYGDQVIDLPKLQIPHPHMNQRQCVLLPLLEIAPELHDPLSKKRFQLILERSQDTKKIIPYL